MQSITADGIDTSIGTGKVPTRRRPLGGFVLPRLLRRPARLIQKAEWHLPRHLGIQAVALLFAATVAGGIVLGGHSNDALSAVTTWGGLAIDDVRISGQSRTDEVDVIHALAMGPFPSLFTFDLDAAKARIEQLPWVADATLRKLYPHQLDIVIHERAPYALWQDDAGKLWLIDATGHRITDQVDDSYAGLPMVAGEGADARVGEFTALLAAAPAIAAHAQAGVLVGGRRWTVVLDTGVELMLPEADPQAALATVVSLDAQEALLSRAITAVDLRDPTHVVLRLDADAQAARIALLKARAKAAKAKT